MKIALVGPEIEENLGLRYLHAGTVSGGHEAIICEFHAEMQIADVVRQVLAYRPDAVGLSMVFTARAREYVRLAEALRQAGWRGHITTGGHFACFHARELLGDVRAIDSVLHGEGERALPDLLDHLDAPEKVAGLTYRAGDRIVTTPPRVPLDDLDELPFPTRPERFHRYFDLPIANVQGGRGCFANCDFCSINAWHRQIGGRRFRQRSVENLAREMAQLYHQRGVRLFDFQDDNFFLPNPAQNEARFTALRAALDGAGVGRIGIQVKARPDTVEPRAMAALKRLGLFRVFLGVESNAVAGLRALGRGLTRGQNQRAIELIKGMGIHLTFNLLMFEPECALADLRENIAFIRAQADVPLNFCRTEVYAGTALERRLRAAGRLEGDYFGYDYTLTDPRCQRVFEIFRHVFVPRNFTLEGMQWHAMTLDYCFHLLRLFHPRAATAALHGRVREFIGALNANNAELLERACAFAERCDPAAAREAARFAESLAQERIAYDAAAAASSRALLCDLHGAAQTMPEPCWSKVGTVSRAAAAVAVFVSVLGSRAHAFEMAPAPAPQRAPGPGGEGPGEGRPNGPIMAGEEPQILLAMGGHMAEMAPGPGLRPPRPATGPLTEMPPADADAVAKAIATAHFSEPLLTLATKHNMADKIVTVRLEVASDGTVFNCEIQTPKDLPPAFQAELRSKLLTWSFPFLKTPRYGTVELKFRPAAQSVPATTQGAPTAAEIADLIHKLGADTYSVRESAQARLIEIGPAALQALETAKQDSDFEIASRAAAAWEAIEYSGAPTIDQLESGKITLGEVPAPGLEHFVQLNNRRKDADVAAHGPFGPEYVPLRRWLPAAELELIARGYTSVDNDHLRRPDGTVVPVR